MFRLLKSVTLLAFFVTSFSVLAEESPTHYNLNAMPIHQLTDKISMHLITGTHMTITQWHLKKGAYLPIHSHLHELVTRVLEGTVEVRSGNDVYTMNPNEIMVFPPHVNHGFYAVSDVVLYEQESPIRQDFLEPDFFEKISDFLSQNQHW